MNMNSNKSRFIGNFIGEGQSRWVYEYTKNPNWVVKITKPDFIKVYNYDPNKREFLTNRALKYCGISDLVSNCMIENNLFLMERVNCNFAKGTYTLPLSFISNDTESVYISNWGKINERIVRIDYPCNVIIIDSFFYVIISENELKGRLKFLNNFSSDFGDKTYKILLNKESGKLIRENMSVNYTIN